MKNQINPTCIQELFESATNAADKGQAAYHTPPEWARVLALPLPDHRPVIVDLTCGDGALLRGARNATTRKLLGCDIDKIPKSKIPKDPKDPIGCLGDSSLGTSIAFIQADLTRLYPLLCEVDFTADLFVLNPPWDLHWHRNGKSKGPKSKVPEVQSSTVQSSTVQGLNPLAFSEVPAVAAAFAAHDGRLGRGEIDSTIATLMIALDRCSAHGEGYLIANEATLQRLLFKPGAPHAALAAHVWAHLVVEGNICQDNSKLKIQNEKTSFQTGVIYFARDHEEATAHPSPPARHTLAEVELVCKELADQRLHLRQGAEVREWNATEETPLKWQAVKQEWATKIPKHPSTQIGSLGTSSLGTYNLWLNRDGAITTALSLFEQHSVKIDKQAAKALFELNGKLPMQLVLQRAQRNALEQAAFGGLWKVAPALQEAVRAAVAEYHAVRAPLYPLPKIQRLGYCDESDTIMCEKDLGTLNSQLSTLNSPEFLAGHSYPIRTTTVLVTRQGSKVNLTGGVDAVEFNGQELAIFITNEQGEEKCFMEERLRDPAVSVNLVSPRATTVRRVAARFGLGTLDSGHSSLAIDFTLHDLVNHFNIPDVADVAALHPQQYERNLQLLEQMENL